MAGRSERVTQEWELKNRGYGLLNELRYGQPECARIIPGVDGEVERTD